MPKYDMLNDLLDGQTEIKVKQVGNKSKKGIMSSLIVLTALTLGAAGLYGYNHMSGETKTNSPELINSLKDTVKSASNTVENAVNVKHAAVQAQEETSFPIYNSSLVNDKNRDILNKVGNFKVKSGLADNQIARSVSQIQFEKGLYYHSLVSEGESFRHQLYADNIGLAFGNGWNVSMQKASYNEGLASAITNDKGMIQKLKTLSGKILNVNKNIGSSDITISPQRSMQVAELMGEQFNVGVLHGISKQMAKNSQAQAQHKATGLSYDQMAEKMFNSLSDNEQAAMRYHCYKVGEAGFSKYVGMIDSLIDYGMSSNRTDAMKMKVAEHIEYTYKINGQVMSDKRAALLVQSMFMGKEQFGYIIAKNVAPQHFSDLPAMKDSGVKVTDDPSKFNFPDAIGDLKTQALKDGKPLKMDLQFTDPQYLAQQKSMQATAPKVTRGWLN